MTFLTLFLGLVTGIQPVELTVVDPEIARIEIRLDGETVGVASGEPWILTADMGEGLAPHRMTAVAFDDQGRQIKKIHQWINTPRKRAEVELLLEGDPAGRVDSVQLVWSSVDVARPETAKVFLDGVELDEVDQQRFSLPSYDVTVPHLLQGEMLLGETTARAQVVIGGGYGTEASGELTALPVFLGEGARLPEAGEMEGWIEVRGQPVRVVAVERPGADVIMIQDLAWYLQRRLKGLRNDWLRTRISTRRRPTGLKSKDHFRLLFPIPEQAKDAAIRSVHYPMSPNLWTGQVIETYAQGAVDRQAAHAIPQGLMVGIPVNGEKKIDTSDQHLSDGVAVAALAAAHGQRARVLLLVAGSDEVDRSIYSPSQVRSYLARLNVPLRVWSPEPEMVASGWGEVEDISTRQRLEQAIRRLRSFLDRQIIVWVDGLHLPEELQLTPAAEGILKRVTEVGPLPAPASDENLDSALRIVELPLPEVATDPEPSLDQATGELTIEQPSFKEKVDVDLVNVEVVATGDGNTRIRDLGREDFRLFVDDEPVEISFFEPPPELATDAAGESGGPPGPESSRTTSATRPALNLVLYVDLVGLRQQQLKRSLQALEQVFGVEEEPPRVMIVVDDGERDISLTFTDDPKAIRAAITELQSRVPKVTIDEHRQVLHEMAEIQKAILLAHQYKDEEQQRSALRSALARRDALDRRIPLLAREQAKRVRDLVESLKRLAIGLGGVDGRLAVLYVGTRMNMTPGGDLFTEAADLMADYSLLSLEISGSSEEDRQSDLLREAAGLYLTDDFDSLLEQASSVGITLYALAPPDVEGQEVTWRDSPGPAARPASVRSEGIDAAACLLANETGGLCQAGGSDMERLIEQAFEDFSASYTLAFTPSREQETEPEGDDPGERYHRIEIEVDRPGVELRHREGYRDRPRERTVADRLVAALTFGEERDELGVQLEMQPQQSTSKEGWFLIPFEVRVPVRRLALAPVASGEKRRASARLLITSMDGGSRTSGIQEYPISFELSEARLASGQPLVYAHKVLLTLAGGEQILAVGLWDDIGRVGSFFRRKLQVGIQAPSQQVPPESPEPPEESGSVDARPQRPERWQDLARSTVFESDDAKPAALLQ